MKVQLHAQARTQMHAHPRAFLCVSAHTTALYLSPTRSLTHSLTLSLILSDTYTYTHRLSFQMYVKPLHDNPGIKVTDEYWTDNFEIVQRCSTLPTEKRSILI